MTNLISLYVWGAGVPDASARTLFLLEQHHFQIRTFEQRTLREAFGAHVEVSLDRPLEPILASLQSALQDEGLSLLHDSNIPSVCDEPTFIISLLAQEISTHSLASIVHQLHELGLHVQEAHTLSHDHLRHAIELIVRGDFELAHLREKCRFWSQDGVLDVSVQSKHPLRVKKRLAVFDMDSTLIQAEVIDELAYAAGIGEAVSSITESAMRGEIDFNESFSQRMALLEGLDESVLEGIAERLPITHGAPRLMRSLKQLGYKTVIISGGFTYFARRVKEQLGMDEIYANKLDIENGRVTGRVVGEVINAERKAQILRDLCAREGIELAQTVAVGDGANDIPMLMTAGLGVAFHAKPLVRKQAPQAISTLGLDGVLYLLGHNDSELAE